ncbi:MAG: acetylxylan esterase [Methylococcaceae bacterium]|jgi:cephalosporin-C deacetylase
MLNFDPTYGYNLGQLLDVMPPPPADDFVGFWLARYQRALALDPQPRLQVSNCKNDDFDCYDIHYTSTDNFDIGGWLLLPKHGQVTRGIIVGHGYGGREQPDFDLPISDAAFLFPCFRGLSRSKCQSVSDNPSLHVLHNIDSREKYILGGCVDDLWLAVSVLQQLYPATLGRIGYLGISFGGGIGALAMPWDTRIQRGHYNVPSFGNQALRLQLPTLGSAAAVQNYHLEHSNILDVLKYYDAAVAAKYIHAPVHVAAALADPVVAPPGQFCIYNALPQGKKLYILEKGHSDYPQQAIQKTELLAEIQGFFSTL